MQYFIAFLEGVITFISPCLLPMLPVYISYFAGAESKSAKNTLKNALAFVLGFTIVFVSMGALAGTVGSFLTKYQVVLNIITGAVVVFFGLGFLGVFKLRLFNGSNVDIDKNNLGFFKSLLLGIVFSIGWTPCVGAFLGSALMLASQQGKALTGIIMLLLYSLGLGVPFVVSAMLIDKLKSTFNFIKKHYKIINIVCGVILIIVGILMMSGLLNKLILILS